jgi:hypothetical protein
MSSWGRHGWPRKDEGMRLYKERDGSYLMLDVPAEGRYHDAVANVMDGPEPSLGSCNIDRNYTYEKGCTRVQWSELPQVWKDAFMRWLGDVKPEEIRGFWLVGEQPR